MPVNQSQRPKFYENQYLGAEDLTAAVEYGSVRDARHALGAHTWGIAMGLQLKERELPGGEIDVYIHPGYAWDGFGRAIVVLEPRKIPAEKFKSFVHDAAIDGGSPEGRLIEVWLRYDETATQMPRPGFEVCDPEDQYSRIQETFFIEVGRRSNHSDRHDSVTVAGHSVDAEQAFQTLDPTDPLIEDESIPHQTFPETGEKRRWLIPLGRVRWKPNPNAGQPGNFVKRAPEDLEQSRRLRRYIGVVAEAIQAAAGHVRLKSRTQTPSLVWSDDVVWVEGNLRVEGDAKLFAGKLDFRDANGADQDVPLWIQRVEDNGQGGKDLRVVVGSDESGKNRLTVGPEVGGTFASRLAVLDNGNVGVSANQPEHQLQIGDATAAVALSLRGPDLNAASSFLAFEDNGGTSQRWFKFIHDTQNNKLKAISADKDPILVLERISGKVGIGTESPRNAIGVRGMGSSEELLSFEDGAGTTKWHINQNLGGSNPGLNFVETGIADGRLFIKAGGNVGIGTTSPLNSLHVAARGHINSIFDSTDNRDHLTLTVGSGGSGIHFGDSNRFFISADPYVERNTLGSGNEVFTILSNGDVGIGTSSPNEKLEVRGNIKMHTDGSLFASAGVENLRVIRGTVRANESADAGTGFTADRKSTGIYEVSFDTPFLGTPTVVATQHFPDSNNFGSNGGDTRDNCVVIAVSPTRFRIKCGNSSGNASNRRFEFIAIGPR